MPRNLRSQNTTLDFEASGSSGTQASRRSRSTQESPPRKNRRIVAVHDSDSEPEVLDYASSATQVNGRTQQRPLKYKRIEVPEIPMKWAAKGFFDLPVIPVLPGSGGSRRTGVEERDDPAALMVKLILISHHSKLVMTNNKLRNSFREHCNVGANVDFDATFVKARRLLRDDFGYVLAEITPQKPVFGADRSRLEFEEESTSGTQQVVDGDDESGTQSGTQSGTKKRKGAAVHYILINRTSPELSFPNLGRKEFRFQREGLSDTAASNAAKTTMLTMSLLYIFMEGGDVPQDQVWSFLKNFGFDPDLNVKFGASSFSVKDLMGQFVKQEYLIQQGKRKGGDVEHIYCQWGPRADLEYSRMAIINLCANVFGTTPDKQHFGERFETAQLLEKLRQRRIAQYASM